LGRIANATRPFSAEHSSTKSKNVNKKVSRISSGVFNDEIGDFDRDFEEELA